jgi:DNA-binding transcriptional MerR regulator
MRRPSQFLCRPDSGPRARPLRSFTAVTSVLVASVEFVRNLNVTPRAIRFYEELGLIQTQRDRLNRRCLDSINCQRLKIIAQLRRGGISLFEIGKALELFHMNGSRQEFERFIDNLSMARVLDLNNQIAAVELARQTILSSHIAEPSSIIHTTVSEERLRSHSEAQQRQMRH